MSMSVTDNVWFLAGDIKSQYQNFAHNMVVFVSDRQLHGLEKVLSVTKLKFINSIYIQYSSIVNK